MKKNRRGDYTGMAPESRVGDANLTPGHPEIKHGMTSQGRRYAVEVVQNALESLQDGQGLAVVGEASLLSAIGVGASYVARAGEYLDGLTGKDLTKAGTLRTIAEIRRWATLHVNLLSEIHKAGLGEQTVSLQERILRIREEQARKQAEEGSEDV